MWNQQGQQEVVDRIREIEQEIIDKNYYGKLFRGGKYSLMNKNRINEEMVEDDYIAEAMQDRLAKKLALEKMGLAYPVFRGGKEQTLQDRIDESEAMKEYWKEVHEGLKKRKKQPAKDRRDESLAMKRYWARRHGGVAVGGKQTLQDRIDESIGMKAFWEGVKAGKELTGGYGTKLGAEHNPWIRFLEKHKGEGLSMEELSKMYKKKGKKGKKKSDNPWIRFIEKHKGQGYSMKELSKMYKKQKK